MPATDAAVQPALPAPAPSANTDATNAAADTAANMANTVNELLQKSDSSPKPAEPPKPAEEPLASNQIAGKKVIKPISDLSAQSKPDLNALLAKEMGTAPAENPAPNTQVAPVPASEAPAPETPQSAAPQPSTPPSPEAEAPVDIKTPGNVVTPGDPNDPNNIAL